MAKYCAKCGRQLPEGVEICPDCNVDVGTEAALFTRMTSEPEVWKAPEGTGKKKKRMRRAQGKAPYIMLAAVIAVIIALIVFLVFFTRPSARVTRALNSDDIEKAYRIYHMKLADEGRDEKLDEAIIAAGERLCDRFAAGELDAQQTADGLNMLYGFGEGTQELLAPVRAKYDELNRSRGSMAEADKLFDNGEYLAAYEVYILVPETDSQYAEAQARAQECFERYSDAAIASARGFEEEHDYTSALKVLAESDAELLNYDTFSADMDAETERLRGEYERHTLAEAENLAELGEYQNAVDLINGCAETLESGSETLTAAAEKYTLLSWDKLVSDAAETADELYSETKYQPAFDALVAAETTLAGLDDERTQKALTDLGQIITEMEKKFVEDIYDRAVHTFDGKRENLQEVVDLFERAHDIRELDELARYKEEFEQYLPANLAEIDYVSKDGVIFRSDSVFEGLDGTNYNKGWLWGVNGASVTFELEGKYDLLSGYFADRRADNANANGHYEIWCDGEQVYKSKTLFHYQTEPQEVNVDISGCNELKIVFICDYNASGSDNGYCYHGLCDLEATKNMPEEMINEQ